MSLSSIPSAIVLDTNVVLDWLVFRDPRVGAVAAAIEAGDVRWLVAPRLRDELHAVLQRGVGATRQPDTDALWATWDRLAIVQPTPVGDWTGQPPCRCTDPDDQKFIDLALLCGARWLLSKDKAVLKVARQASRLGLTIQTPAQWDRQHREHP